MKTENEYLQNPFRCPYCDTENLWAEEIKGDGISAWGTVYCRDCNKYWIDCYTLTGYDFLK